MRPSTNTDIAGAQMLYDKALKFNPDHPTVLYNYAVLLEDARQAKTLKRVSFFFKSHCPSTFVLYSQEIPTFHNF